MSALRRYVTEGPTGILTIRREGETQRFVPNSDEDAARELLLEFQSLVDADGRVLKDNYHAEGFNWYPAMVSYLYWYVFWPYVRYQPLVHEAWSESAEFVAEAGGQFCGLLDRLRPPVPDARAASSLHTLLFRWNNRLAGAKRNVDILFFRFAVQDFRTTEIRGVLDELGVRYLDVLPAPSVRQIAGSILRGGSEYYFSQPPRPVSGNFHTTRYTLDHLPADRQRLFESTVECMERCIAACKAEYRQHRRALSQCSARTLYGLDDVNNYIFPVIFASRSLGMKTIGHQHGGYVKRHAGYRMEGIAADDFQWFHHVIVWGEYWKEKMLRDSQAYGPDFFIVGSNKFSSIPAASSPVERLPRTVLIPYEFLANTEKVGRYMQRLVDLGYHVIFKTRPDEAVEAQLDAYSLPQEYRAKIEIAPRLPAEILDRVDIVAGTMTTLIYELLPAGKIIWILETEFRHLADLVEEGFAHAVALDSLPTPEQCNFPRTYASREKLFGHETLTESLRKNVAAAPGTQFKP